jgi:hypothetical protein
MESDTEKLKPTNLSQVTLKFFFNICYEIKKKQLLFIIFTISKNL